MDVYRILTGFDDAAFCHRVTEALNKGWSLYGSPSITYDPEQKRVICAQASAAGVQSRCNNSGIARSPRIRLGNRIEGTLMRYLAAPRRDTL